MVWDNCASTNIITFKVFINLTSMSNRFFILCNTSNILELNSQYLFNWSGVSIHKGLISSRFGFVGFDRPALGCKFFVKDISHLFLPNLTLPSNESLASSIWYLDSLQMHSSTVSNIDDWQCRSWYWILFTQKYRSKDIS